MAELSVAHARLLDVKLDDLHEDTPIEPSIDAEPWGIAWRVRSINYNLLP